MRIAVCFLLLMPAVVGGKEPAVAAQPISAAAARRASVAYSDSFVVRSYRSDLPAAKLLPSCERLRTELQTIWLGKISAEAWRPRCEVVLHASRESYQQAVGRGAGQTSGSSMIRFERQQPSLRRIDLASNAQGSGSALAHELTHVIIADRFRGRQPPRWADEGIATLSDRAEKQALHERDLQHALSNGTSLPLTELLSLERCSTYEQFATFYGQSLSLVGFLVEQDSPERFIAFVDVAMSKGYDYALRRTYGIDSVAQLDRAWRERALKDANSPAIIQAVSLHQTGSPKETTAARAPQLFADEVGSE
jgi:hypothetical protein